MNQTTTAETETAGPELSQQSTDTSIRVDRTVALSLQCYRNRLQQSVDSQPQRYPFYLRHKISMGEALCYLIEQHMKDSARRRRLQARRAATKYDAKAPSSGG